MSEKEVILAHEQPVIADALGGVIDRDVRFSVIDVVGNGDDLFDAAQKNPEAISIASLRIQDASFSEIATEMDTAPMALVFDAKEHTIRRALRCNAHGILCADDTSDQILYTIEGHKTEKPSFSPAVKVQAQRLIAEGIDNDPYDGLTERQFQVLTGLANGQSIKQVAFSLGISPKTAEMHRDRLKNNLGIFDLVSLTKYAIRRGIVSVDE